MICVRLEKRPEITSICTCSWRSMRVAGGQQEHRREQVPLDLQEARSS